MHEPTVADLMSRHPATAMPSTAFRALVATMLSHRVDGIPVIDPLGRPLGVVEAPDILAKLEFHCGADQAPLLATARSRARRHKSRGLVAADLMTTPAVTITAGTPLTVAVRALTGHNLTRIHVIDHHARLVGVLTHHDVLGLFLRSDDAVRDDVRRAIATTTRRHPVDVLVLDGVVTLSGALPLRSTVDSLGDLASHVPGVIAIHNQLTYHLDDLMVTGL